MVTTGYLEFLTLLIRMQRRCSARLDLADQQLQELGPVHRRLLHLSLLVGGDRDDIIAAVIPPE